MAISVHIVSDRRDLTEFIRLAADVYRDDPHWIAPLEREVRRTLDPARNPYYRSATLRLFLARRDGRPAARIAITVSQAHADRWGERVAFFGFFEASDPEAAAAVFAEAESYCAAEGVTAIEGPFNPCHYSELGMLDDTFDRPPSFFQTYNPSWYNAQLAALGYGMESRKYTARNDDCAGSIRARYGELADRRQLGEYTIRNFDMKRRVRDLEFMREIFNDSFSENWHFLPSTKEEFAFGASMIAYVTDPELILLLEYRGMPVGVTMFVYDINPLLRPMRGKLRLLQLLGFQRRKRGIRNLILYAGGIKKEFRGSRGYALMLNAALRLASRFDTLECTWVSADNDQARASADKLGLTEDRHYTIYRKQVKP